MPAVGHHPGQSVPARRFGNLFPVQHDPVLAGHAQKSGRPPIPDQTLRMGALAQLALQLPDRLGLVTGILALDRTVSTESYCQVTIHLVRWQSMIVVKPYRALAKSQYC